MQVATIELSWIDDRYNTDSRVDPAAALASTLIVGHRLDQYDVALINKSRSRLFGLLPAAPDSARCQPLRQRLRIDGGPERREDCRTV